MAYSSANFVLLNGGLSNTRCNEWLLDTTDAIAAVNTSGYVSDGVRKGAQKGDVVKVRIWDTIGTGTCSAIHLCWVIGVSDDGIDLTDGLAVTSTNTD